MSSWPLMVSCLLSEQWYGAMFSLFQAIPRRPGIKNPSQYDVITAENVLHAVTAITVTHAQTIHESILQYSTAL